MQIFFFHPPPNALPRHPVPPLCASRGVCLPLLLFHILNCRTTEIPVSKHPRQTHGTQRLAGSPAQKAPNQTFAVNACTPMLSPAQTRKAAIPALPALGQRRMGQKGLIKNVKSATCCRELPTKVNIIVFFDNNTPSIIAPYPIRVSSYTLHAPSMNNGPEREIWPMEDDDNLYTKDYLVNGKNLWVYGYCIDQDSNIHRGWRGYSHSQSPTLGKTKTAGDRQVLF